MAGEWYDDPQGTYEWTIDNLERCFRDGVITGAECGMARGVAEDCLRRGLAGRAPVNREDKP